MKPLLGGVAAFAAAAGLALSAAAAQSGPAPARPPAPASAIAAPRLAADVKAQPAYDAAPDRFVLAAPTPLFADINVYGMTVGRLDKAGEPVPVLAKVRGWDWYLVGRNGTGVGYVPRALLKPAES